MDSWIIDVDNRKIRVKATIFRKKEVMQLMLVACVLTIIGIHKTLIDFKGIAFFGSCKKK